MSIHAFPAPAVLPVVAAARDLVTSGASVGVAAVPDGEVAEAIAGLAALEAQAQAWRLALEAEAEARALAERDAATGTDAWVAALTGSTREVAAGGIRLARLLEDGYLWFGRPWLYMQADPFVMTRALQLARTTPY